MDLTQIVGQSSWTRALRQNILQIARFPCSVLISGPSGTGKELVARAIHRHSPRACQAFVPVDCTSLSGDLFASHLFGHVKGAFTGADYERIGCFRAAQGGTILLDEIGEMSLDLQSKLLRTIQERAVVPVGGDRPVPVDVRIVVATNRDLSEEVRCGRFRLDLFYRLNVVALETIPLAERVEDIEPLAAYFLNNMAVERGYPLTRLSSAALAALQAYSWPGNVRELQNVLERAAVFATGDLLDIDVFPQEIHAAWQSPLLGAPSAVDSADEGPWPSLAEVEREHVRRTLARAEHNQSATARLLNINRATLARKISEYRLTLPDAHRGRPRKERADSLAQSAVVGGPQPDGPKP